MALLFSLSFSMSLPLFFSVSAVDLWQFIRIVAGMAKIKGATVVGLSVAPVYYGGYLPHPDNRLTPSWSKPRGISLPHLC